MDDGSLDGRLKEWCNGRLKVRFASMAIRTTAWRCPAMMAVLNYGQFVSARIMLALVTMETLYNERFCLNE